MRGIGVLVQNARVDMAVLYFQCISLVGCDILGLGNFESGCVYRTYLTFLRLRAGIRLVPTSSLWMPRSLKNLSDSFELSPYCRVT